METHYLTYEGNGRWYFAKCGRQCLRDAHADAPDCASCQRVLREEAEEASRYASVDEQADAVFGRPDPTAKPVFAGDPNFDPCADYRPQRSR